MEIFHYINPSGNDVYQEWLDELRDIVGRISIQRRVDRANNANTIGSHRFCGNDVWEMKIDVGPGYHIYYAKIKKGVVLLLCGGTKKT